ncbi:MAG: hypothetical protein Crog4KO_22200 [Crocinitomicaceae bacterium]
MQLYVHTILIVLGLCFSNAAFGQDLVYGKVVDKNGDPISGAKVFWDSRNETERDPQLSGPNGSFAIGYPRDSTIALKVTFAGKVDINKFLHQAEYNEFITITMLEKGTTSMTASRWEQSVYDIPASTVIITREEIEENGYINLQEVLENVPGLFTMDHRNESGVSLGVRGFWSDVNRNVMIQVNGVNMISERRNYYALDKMNVAVESIDKIEIVRGTMNVMYGAGAFFGVINIITNENQRPYNGLVATGFGLQSINNDQFSAGFKYPGAPLSTIQKNVFSYSGGKEGFQVSLNAMTFHRGGFHEIWRDMISDSIPDTIPGYPEATTGASYYYDTIRPARFRRNHQALNLSANYNGFFLDVNYAASNYGHCAWLTPGTGDGNYLQSHAGNYQVGYRGSNKNERFSHQTKVAYMKTNNVGEYKYYIDSTLSFGEDRCETIRAEFNTRASIIKSENPENLNFDLLTGLYFSRNLENNSYYNLPEIRSRSWFTGLDPDSHVDTKAAYMQAEVKIPNWVFVGGLRVEAESGYRLLDYKNVGYHDSISGAELGGDASDTTKFIYSYVGADKPGLGAFYTPRLAVIHKIPTKKEKSVHYLRGMYGIAYRQATPVQNAFDIMRSNYNNEVGADIDTNWVHLDYLRPERIRTLEFSYTFVNEEVGLDLSANFFLNGLRSLFVKETFADDDGSFNGVSKNSGQLVTQGVELIAKRRFKIPLSNGSKINLRSSVSLSLQNTRNVAPDSVSAEVRERLESAPVAFSPNTLGTANIAARYKSFTVGLSANYVGKMRSYTPQPQIVSTDSVIIESPLGDSTHAYTRISLNLRVDNIRLFKEESGGFYINFKIANLLNRQYKYPTYSNVLWAERGVLGRPRQFLLSIGYVF